MKQKIFLVVSLMLANIVKAQDTIPFLDPCFGYTPLYIDSFNNFQPQNIPYTNDVFYHTHCLNEFSHIPVAGNHVYHMFVGEKSQNVLGIAICHKPEILDFDRTSLQICEITFPQETTPQINVLRSLSGSGDVYSKQMVYSFGDSLLPNPRPGADTLGTAAPCFIYLFDSAVPVSDTFYLAGFTESYFKSYYALNQVAGSFWIEIYRYSENNSGISPGLGPWQNFFPVYSLPCPAPGAPTVEVGDDGTEVVRWRQGYDTALYQLQIYTVNGQLLLETDTLSDTAFVLTDSLWSVIGYEQSGNLRVRVRKACDYLESPYHTLVWSDYSKSFQYFHVHATDGIGGVGMPSTACFTLSPNPATQRVALERPEGYGGEEAVLTVCDLAGREVLSCPVRGTFHELDVSQWPRGVYLLRLTTPTASSLRRLVVE